MTINVGDLTRFSGQFKAAVGEVAPAFDQVKVIFSSKELKTSEEVLAPSISISGNWTILYNFTSGGIWYIRVEASFEGEVVATHQDVIKVTPSNRIT